MFTKLLMVTGIPILWDGWDSFPCWLNESSCPCNLVKEERWYSRRERKVLERGSKTRQEGGVIGTGRLWEEVNPVAKVHTGSYPPFVQPPFSLSIFGLALSKLLELVWGNTLPRRRTAEKDKEIEISLLTSWTPPCSTVRKVNILG